MADGLLSQAGWTPWNYPRADSSIEVRYGGVVLDYSRAGQICLPDGSVHSFKQEHRGSMVKVINGPLFTGSSWYEFNDQRYDTFVSLVQGVKQFVQRGSDDKQAD